MCGICGVISLDGSTIDNGLIDRMASTLIHRGPDEEGYYFNQAPDQSSIIDLRTGQQPLSNEDGTIWISFNGEIYNFQELRCLLEAKGHLFRTNSDTETIVHAYEEWGEACLNRLQGMFAFAIWNDKEKELLLARDRIGKKPLYYYLDGNRLTFASEIKAIVQDKEVRREINLEALSDYLSLLYIPAPKTIFKKISKLEAGHFLVYGMRGLRKMEYWDLSFAKTEEKPEEKWYEEIVTKLTESVGIRLNSEVPLGAFLSGGIDSSAVVAIMAEILKNPIITNSIGFKESTFNELSYARKVADLFHTDHYEYTVTPDAMDIVDKLPYYFDEPFADSSAVPTYYVSQVAKQNVTVALSGDGGDENFAGYRRYYYDRLENRIRKNLPMNIFRPVFAGLAYGYPKADWLPQVFRAKSLLTNLSLSPAKAFFYSVSQLLPGFKEKILSEEVRQVLQGYDTFSLFDTYFARVATQTNDPLSRVQYIDMKTYLADDILTKVDRASMANSLEVRVPILDHKFMEFVATIPSYLKLNGGKTKHIFKRAMFAKLPKEVLYRKKMGFSIPIKDWLKKELKEFAGNILLSSNSKQHDFFDRRYTKKLWKEHQQGIANNSGILWTLLVFENWWKRWM
jgi:asparagine synthase (glutamine-hydrolysing)